VCKVELRSLELRLKMLDKLGNFCWWAFSGMEWLVGNDSTLPSKSTEECAAKYSQSKFLFTLDPIFNLANNRLILMKGEVVLLFLLLFLAGTVLDVVFVVDVAFVVVVVAAAVVVVVFVVAAGAGAVLFPLFICNHAQDHLAHLLTERHYQWTPVTANIPEQMVE